MCDMLCIWFSVVSLLILRVESWIIMHTTKLHKYMYSGPEDHNTKYKLYVRLNQAKGNDYALSLLSYLSKRIKFH